MKILAIDIETTGLRPDTHEIWEVGLAWTSPEGSIASRSWLVRPSHDAVWGEVAREMAAGVDLTSAQELCDVWPQIEAHLQDADLIVAHGAPFERGFLEAVAAGDPAWLAPKRWACTLALAQALLPRPHTLAATCAALGLASPPPPTGRGAPHTGIDASRGHGEDSMGTVFYEITAELRAPELPRMRQLVTVTDPLAWAWRCFGLDFAALCATCTTRDGLLYVQPSRAWMPCATMGDGCEVRLLGVRRVVPGSLAHNLTSRERRAAAGEVGDPIKRRTVA